MKKLLLIGALAFGLNAFGQVPSYVPTNGLVGWWGFNGNTIDGSGNGNNGVLNGASLTSDRFGNPNDAYDFDGIDDYIEVINNYDYENKTISLWLNADDISGTWNDAKFAISIDSDALNYGMSNILIDTDTLSLRAGGEPTVFRTPVNANEWVHIVVVRSASSTEYYLNGSSIGLGVSGTLGSSANPNPNLVIGSGRTKTVQFFDGTIDDLGIWDRALDSCEITELYTGQACNVGIEELLQSEKELVKIVDFMGRETEFKPNTPLIFIYSDGTRERVMKLEE
jgi:hypothetical protein